MKNLLTMLAFAGITTFCQAAVKITQSAGWHEGGYVMWTPEEGATSYEVYVRPEGGEYSKIDAELVRDYGTYGRADVMGLKAGNYQWKIVPVGEKGAMTDQSSESDVWTATAFDRSGFAHQGITDGVGAYNNDGTLKKGAKVLYVHADNAKTITTNVITSSKGGTTAGVGLQEIIYLYQKGYDTTPLDIRIIGTIKAENMDRLDSSEEGLQIKGRNAYSPMNMTIEGVGNDATIWGFGILCRNCTSVEMRNFAVMMCMDDAISLDTENSHIWVHNLDLFYGKPGSASDQVKGDGTVDVKGKSTNVTVSYNHFFDNGKSSLGGMKSETTDCVLTYHHNWFDHSDSRHPRIRTMSFHIYNNYFDGNSKYGVGMTYGGSAFVENNYFRNCKYPMLISRQGTDATGDGTFSGENGGVIKSYNNYMTGQRRYKTISSANATGTDWDAYEVASASEQIPENILCNAGGTPYNNFDTNGMLTYSYTADPVEDVPSIVTGERGAGRCQGGDFHWTFDNAKEDTNSDIIPELKAAIQNYKSSLVGFYGQPISNGGGTGEVNGGNQTTTDGSIIVYDYQAGVGTTTPSADGSATLGESVKIYMNKESVNSIKFTSSMPFTAGTAPAEKYVKIAAAEGAFMAGDTIIISGVYVNPAEKESAIRIVSEEGNEIALTQQLINGRLVADEPVVEKHILSEGTNSIYLGRKGNTSTYVLTLKVVRPAIDSAIQHVVLKPQQQTIYDLFGRRVSTPQSGKIYIIDGKKTYMRNL